LSYKLVDEKHGEYQRYAAFDSSGKVPVSVSTWTDLLSSPTQILKLVDKIKEASQSYPAFFFETKGVSQKTMSKQFEFVLVNSKDLHSFVQDHGNDFHVFAEYLQDKGSTDGAWSSVSFLNLDQTSTLIAPKAIQPLKDIYTDIGKFIRNAPEQEIICFWQLVLREFKKSVGRLEADGDKGSIWLSTSGMGVAWLHMRIDRRPKYYTFRAFAEET